MTDEDGKPVGGAVVGTSGTHHSTPNTFTPAGSDWDFSPGVLSQPDGAARIPDEGYINCVVARHVVRKLVGVAAVNKEQLQQSEPLQVVMHPECLVSGALTAKELEARHHKLDWTNVYVELDERARPLSCDSHQAEFHFFLPPGTYTLNAYATFPDTLNVRKPITIKPGQRELKVEPIDLPPTGLMLLEGKPAPELRDIVAWKNGGPLKLTDLRGKVVILVFRSDAPMWDDTMKSLLAAYDKYRQQGLMVIELRINDSDALDSQAKIDEHLASIKTPVWSGREIPIPIALVVPHHSRSAKPDAKPQELPIIVRDYGITSTPNAVLIDRQGRVVGKLRFRGELDEVLLEKVLGQE